MLVSCSSSDIHFHSSVVFKLKTALLLMQTIFGNGWRHLLGEKEFWEHIGGVDISLVPSSFGQANTQVHQNSN